MTGRIEKFFRIAKEAARNSECHFRHGAVLAKSSRVLNVSGNINRYCKFADFHRTEDGHGTIHAEIGAILGISRSVLRSSDVYVIRINREGELMNSRPCDMCMTAMQHVGIKRVFYSITDSEFGVLNLKRS